MLKYYHNLNTKTAERSAFSVVIGQAIDGVMVGKERRCQEYRPFSFLLYKR